MSTVSLTVKPVAGDGTTSYVDGNNLPAAELQADFDAIVNWANGDIDEDNISASAQIANSQLADIAATKVTSPSSFTTTTSPGDSATPSAPTTYAAEAARSFYKMGMLRGYTTNAKYMNSSAVATDATWFEPPIAGPNLLKNPGFEVQSGGAGTAPDGWSLVGTPSTLAIENPAFDEYGLEKRSVNIVTDAANEGISTTVSGLKDSAKYLIGMAYTITDNGTTPGVIRLSTTNALASGNYRNLALDGSTEAASTVVITQGIVKAQSPPATITVTISATESGADFNVIEAWMYELSEGYPVDRPAIPMQVADYTTLDDAIAGGGAATWTTLSDLSLSQYVPFAGYRFTYEATLCFRGPAIAGSVRKYVYAFRIQQQIDAGAAATVEGPYSWIANQQTNNEFIGGTVTLKYVIENPTPGSTYAFTVDAFVENDGADEAATMTMNPTVGGGTAVAVSRSRLIVEKL